ncbi:MAG: sorbosone dehydrogenase [Gemmatimonadales bacterium]|nr:sorbosone dehydrogenase [Gemmatimonadales bacterium]
MVGERLGSVRHIVVADNGDIYAGVRGRGGGGLLALRDTDGDGRADMTRTIGRASGTGVALHGGYLYFAPNDRIVRYRLEPGALVPTDPPETVVKRLPTGGHGAKTMAFGLDGALFVDFGSRSNSCQAQDRSARSPGRFPCTELEDRAGIWRFDPSILNQRPADGTRWATGLRNPMALAVHPETGQLFFASHGRDQLSGSWGFTAEQNAENPAEEFGVAAQGDDYGWPYCYHDPQTNTKVLAPEYGGNGAIVGRCAPMKDPLIGFPAHWAPMALAFNTMSALGPEYQGGAFLAFHGSWNRAPLPQEGFRVVYIPFADGRPTGEYSTFATGAGGRTSIRPSGVAMGPDGSLYIAADRNRKIWRVMREDRR